MCTLAILPSGTGRYLLGHNRDELRTRAKGLPPSRGESGGIAFLAPRDPEGGGTWICAAETGVTFCMLNAAHADPGRLTARPPSRGTLPPLLAPLTSPDEAAAFLEGGSIDLADMRGFHLVMVTPGAPGHPPAASRFRWDGVRLARDDRPLPALFVSSGYDQGGAEAARALRWRSFLAGGDAPGVAALEGWLADHEPERGVLSVCMHGERAATVSRTVVEVTAERIRMLYHGGAPCDAAATDHVAEIGARGPGRPPASP